MMNQPLLTIYCLVYNHGKFLRQCLDSFVSQKVNFPVEIVIHDDASTDDSQQIIREYMERYPEWNWHPLFQEQNQYSRGNCVMKLSMPQVRGKYLAWCEGDDYWTDPYKLQKQVDFLEANPDFSICHHPARMVWEGGEEPDAIWPAVPNNDAESVHSLEHLVLETRLATCTAVYRWCFNREDYKFEEQFPDNIFPADYMLHIMHAKHGKMKKLTDCMSFYRIHGGGAWSLAQNTDNFYMKNAIKLMRFYTEAERISELDFSIPRQKMLHECILSCLATIRFDVLAELQLLYPKDYLTVIEQYTREERSNHQAQWDHLVKTTPFLTFLKAKLSKKLGK